MQLAKDNEYYDLVLTYFAKNISKFCYLLVYLVQKNNYDHVATSNNILTFLFANGFFKDDKKLISHINSIMCNNLPYLARTSDPEYGKI